MSNADSIFQVAKGTTVVVNGRTFIVSSSNGRNSMSLRGVRGGRGFSVERNIHSGALLFATRRGTELVETFEVAA